MKCKKGCIVLIMLVLISTTTLSIYAFESKSSNCINNNFLDIPIQLSIIANGFTSPVFLTNSGDGTNRLFVVDQIGIIYVIENNILLDNPFIDISDKIVPINPIYDERGLLGLAFHPDYENNGRFFVYYSSPKSGTGIDHESILAEYKVSDVNPNIADPTSEKIIFRVNQPESNHNGGQIEFGPDGYLYIALGDGGGAGDVHGTIGNGQDINTHLGSILRIDVNNGDPYSIPSDNPFVGINGLDEIYAYGFRNPWKFSFDIETNQFFVADVGQDLWEEIDIVQKGGNYGWRIMEGNHFYDENLLTTLGLTLDDLEFPIYEYSHDIGKTIIGGYVYRANPESTLYGKYVFGDWSSDFASASGRLYYLEETQPGIWIKNNLLVDGSNNINRFILSFGKDEAGNLYVLSKTALGPSGTTGDVRKIIIENQKPIKPVILGPESGKVGIDYNFTFTTTDPDNENVYYYIEWGDGTVQDWIGPYFSGEEVIISHTFTTRGNLNIKAKAKDINNLESEWGSFSITMPKNQFNQFIQILYYILQFFFNLKLF